MHIGEKPYFCSACGQKNLFPSRHPCPCFAKTRACNVYDFILVGTYVPPVVLWRLENGRVPARVEISWLLYFLTRTTLKWVFFLMSISTFLSQSVQKSMKHRCIATPCSWIIVQSVILLPLKRCWLDLKLHWTLNWLVRLQQCAAVYLNIRFVLKFLTINFLARQSASTGHMRDNMRVIIITITSSRTRCPACREALMMYSPIIYAARILSNISNRTPLLPWLLKFILSLLLLLLLPPSCFPAVATAVLELFSI